MLPIVRMLPSMISLKSLLLLHHVLQCSGEYAEEKLTQVSDETLGAIQNSTRLAHHQEMENKRNIDEKEYEDSAKEMLVQVSDETLGAVQYSTRLAQHQEMENKRNIDEKEHDDPAKEKLTQVGDETLGAIQNSTRLAHHQ